MPSETLASKPWFKKRRIAIPLAIVVFVLTGCSGGSDTSSTSATPVAEEVAISFIEDASWGDDQFELDENKEFPEDAGFYFGPTFKVNQPPGTKMDCTFIAYDKNKQKVGTHSYRANTLNDGSVIAYGEMEKWYIDSTESDMLRVDFYDVKCTL